MGHYKSPYQTSIYMAEYIPEVKTPKYTRILSSFIMLYFEEGFIFIGSKGWRIFLDRTACSLRSLSLEFDKVGK